MAWKLEGYVPEIKHKAGRPHKFIGKMCCHWGLALRIQGQSSYENDIESE